MTRDGLVLRIKRDDWDSLLQTNLSEAFFSIRQVLPAMVRERWGRIVNISSVVGEADNAGQVNYAASKAGLIGMTKALAQEVASRNITMNAVAPGLLIFTFFVFCPLGVDSAAFHTTRNLIRAGRDTGS
jgi:3-oxoacyl-[acyl-carrier protein] reductase